MTDAQSTWRRPLHTVIPAVAAKQHTVHSTTHHAAVGGAISFIHYIGWHVRDHQQHTLPSNTTLSNSIMDDDAKSSFEAERDKILSEIPQKIKDQFGQIAFAIAHDEDDDDDDDEPPTTVTGTPFPCLVLDPYSVPPRPYRDVYWFDMFQKSKGKNKKPLQHVVYHYGHDVDDCYSFVECDKLTYYDDALAQGLVALPPALVAKMDNKEPLAEQEQQRITGMQELEQDLLKEPTERKRGVVFLERHEEPAKKKAPPAKRQKTKK
jgi:hypothetical protein